MMAAVRRLHLIASSVTLADAIKDIEFCNNGGLWFEKFMAVAMLCYAM